MPVQQTILTNTPAFPEPVPPTYPNPGATPKRPHHYRIPVEKGSVTEVNTVHFNQSNDGQVQNKHRLQCQTPPIASTQHAPAYYIPTTSIPSNIYQARGKAFPLS